MLSIACTRTSGQPRAMAGVTHIHLLARAPPRPPWPPHGHPVAAPRPTPWPPCPAGAWRRPTAHPVAALRWGVETAHGPPRGRPARRGRGDGPPGRLYDAPWRERRYERPGGVRSLPAGPAHRGRPMATPWPPHGPPRGRPARRGCGDGPPGRLYDAPWRERRYGRPRGVRSLPAESRSRGRPSNLLDRGQVLCYNFPRRPCGCATRRQAG